MKDQNKRKATFTKGELDTMIEKDRNHRKSSKIEEHNDPVQDSKKLWKKNAQPHDRRISKIGKLIYCPVGNWGEFVGSRVYYYLKNKYNIDLGQLKRNQWIDHPDFDGCLDDQAFQTQNKKLFTEFLPPSGWFKKLDHSRRLVSDTITKHLSKNIGELLSTIEDLRFELVESRELVSQLRRDAEEKNDCLLELYNRLLRRDNSEKVLMDYVRTRGLNLEKIHTQIKIN